MASGRHAAVVTPGNHDGVHLGHRALVDAARKRAHAAGLEAVALFFDPHPTEVLAPERAKPLLTTPKRRAQLLQGAGADRAVAWDFDRELAATAPEEFVRRVLVDALGARGIVVGPDFRFGRKRAGDVALLRELGKEHGFDVEVVEPVELDGERVSSTRIRDALDAGDVGAAAALLGRIHDVTGTVVQGDGRGRQIGFRTANLDVDRIMLPADGVYAVVARLLDEPDQPRLAGVANLGVRPTVEAGRAVEVHLFDFDREVYGAHVRVGFVERIRPEKRFDGLEALKAQIGRDADAARGVLDGIEEERVQWV